MINSVSERRLLLMRKVSVLGGPANNMQIRKDAADWLINVIANYDAAVQNMFIRLMEGNSPMPEGVNQIQLQQQRENNYARALQELEQVFKYSMGDAKSPVLSNDPPTGG